MLEEATPDHDLDIGLGLSAIGGRNSEVGKDVVNKAHPWSRGHVSGHSDLMLILPDSVTRGPSRPIPTTQRRKQKGRGQRLNRNATSIADRNIQFMPIMVGNISIYAG